MALSLLAQLRLEAALPVADPLGLAQQQPGVALCGEDQREVTLPLLDTQVLDLAQPYLRRNMRCYSEHNIISN